MGQSKLMSKMIVQVKLNLIKQTVDNLNKSIYVCDSVVSRIAFAQDALRNRKLLTNCSGNWKGSSSKTSNKGKE